MILVPILNIVLVTDNDVLIPEIICTITATLVVHLNLEILIAVKVHIVVDLVSPLSIVSVPIFDLVRPPRNLLLDLAKVATEFLEIFVLEVKKMFLLPCFLLPLLFLLLLLGDFDISKKIFRVIWVFFNLFEGLFFLVFLDNMFIYFRRLRFFWLLYFLGIKTLKSNSWVPTDHLQSFNDSGPRFKSGCYQILDN